MYSIPFLDIPPLAGVAGTVRLPGSKSISNRVLLLAALCEGTTTLHDVLASDDTSVMLDALKALGCQVTQTGETVTVRGLGASFGNKLTADAQLFMGNAGTAMRPLTAALAVLGGNWELSGVPRMHERPIGDLVDALRQLGCHIDYLGQDGFPPLRIGQPALKLDQPIQVRGDVSSQFLTALLMALPLVAKRDIVIQVVGELISKPYIEITLNLLARFGVVVQRPEGKNRWQQFTIPAGAQLRSPGVLHVEADASSASYFIALGGLIGSNYAPKIEAFEPHIVLEINLKVSTTSLRIEGVGLDSIQGDIHFVQAARQMGIQVSGGPNWLQVAPASWPLKAIDLDCNHIPDAAMTLAVMALYADGPSILRNIASWRVKETDRITAMACELRKLGATVEEGPDFIRVWPISDAAAQGRPKQGAAPSGGSDMREATSVGAIWKPATIHTYDDHRMAMCFSLAALNPAGLPVRIEDPKCVGKTFPDYFETLFAVAQTATAEIPVLCVDGPTASGKGTLAQELAQRLGYHFLDSGSIYRITGLAAVRQGLAPTPEFETRIVALLAHLKLRFDSGKVWLDGEDVSALIRTEEAGINASKVSALPQVRAALVDLQHGFRQLPGLVADGRDMGTVIFPGARLKVYLTATPERRAQRRHKQLISKGIPSILPSLHADLEARDLRDSSRTVAPLKAAQDAQLLDNSDTTVEQSVEQVLAWWQSKQPFSL